MNAIKLQTLKTVMKKIFKNPSSRDFEPQRIFDSIEYKQEENNNVNLFFC